MSTQPKVQAFDAFLCRAWGETDLPSAELVADWDGVRRFMVREWLGADDATDYDGTVTLDRLKADFDEHEEDERGSLYEIEFEIGGVSIERVVGSRPVPPVEDLLVMAVECGVIPMSKVMDTDLQDALTAFAKRVAA